MAERKTKLRVCLVASGGGHLSQLLKLSDGWKGHETVCVTTSEVVRDRLRDLGRVYVVGECNRNNPWRVMRVFVRCSRALLREKPDVIISTGAAVGCIACYIGKLLGARVIWIDSITNIERISLSGRMVRYISDLFLVQWAELRDMYPGVEFAGSVI